MDVKKKIMFIVPSMRGGGSERIMSILVNHLDREIYDIILILLKKEGQYLDDLPNDIEIVDLNVKGTRFAIPQIISMIKNYKPDIVFSTLGYLNLLISIIKPFLSKQIKFIARESSIVSVNNRNSKYPNLFDLLYKIFYNNFDLIICQSDYMKNDLIKNYKIKKEKMVVINNPVNIEHINKLSTKSDKLLFDRSKINLLTVGRLSKEKGYDMLLQAISKLDSNYHLTIIGMGNEENALKSLVKKLSIEHKVDFIGIQENPYKYMRAANLFISSSRHEGFPNVVLEANACSTPVVAFDCPGGTREIIENDLNGFLVECGNIDKLVEKIIVASDYPWNKNDISNLINSKYKVDRIIYKYEQNIMQTIVNEKI